MSVFWLVPQAWWGLTALAIPIAIHLLARQRSRRVPFPSLRFLQTTRLTAMRRRTLSDWPLLVVRVLLVTAAVAALAGPVFVSDARRAGWARRVARAIVVAPISPGQAAANTAIATQSATAADQLVLEEARASFTSVVLTPSTIPDGLRAAAIWLAHQPPAAQEVVIIGDLREATFDRADLAGLPPQVGVRFLPLPGAESQTAATVRVVNDGQGDEPSTYDVRVVADDTETTAHYLPAADQRAPRIVVRASASQQSSADAVLRAVLRDGVALGHHGDRAVTVVFAGGTDAGVLTVPSAMWARRVLEQLPEAHGGEAGGGLVVVAPMAATDIRAAPFLSRVSNLAFVEPRSLREPRRLSAASLAAWSRPPGPVSDVAVPVDEGDRRWLWAAALTLMMIEHWLRRMRRATTPIATTEAAREVRVA